MVIFIFSDLFSLIKQTMSIFTKLMLFFLAHFYSFGNLTLNLLKLKDITLGFAGDIFISGLKKKDSVSNQQIANFYNGY